MLLVRDEGVDRQIVDRLREDGHKVVYIAEVSPRASDNVVVAETRARGAVLVTADRDFGELMFRQRALSSGVMFVRLAGVSPDRKAEVVSSVVKAHAAILPGGFTVVTGGQVRHRPLPPAPRPSQ